MPSTADRQDSLSGQPRIVLDTVRSQRTTCPPMFWNHTLASAPGAVASAQTTAAPQIRARLTPLFTSPPRKGFPTRGQYRIFYFLQRQPVPPAPYTTFED